MTKILLVEDDKSLREIYGVRFLAEGYDIVSAGDGEEALAMAIKERPALIVSDVMMPKISGFDMLDILRSTTETRDIKVIMMTALSSEDQRLRGEKLGADRYLVKSQVGIEDVVRTVHEVLGDMPGMVLNNQPQTSQQPIIPTQTPSQVERPDISALSPQQPEASPPPQPGLTNMAMQPPTNSSLPRPTAPFSSEAPRPANLGSRSLQPLSSSNPASMDELMARELNGGSAPQLAQPQVTPLTIPTPQPIGQPQVQPIQPQPVGLIQNPQQNNPLQTHMPTQPISQQQPPIPVSQPQIQTPSPHGMDINPISGHQIPNSEDAQH